MSKVIIFICCLLIYNKGFTQTPANDPHWELEWEDHFNSFDNSRWIKAHYCDHGGEPQLYLDNYVWTSGGNLVIKVDNNSVNCPSNPPGPTTWACGSCQTGTHNYTSGWVETTSSFNSQFGYLEARIKLPYRYGFWPAFWTWRGSGVPTTNEAEIDIFEMLGHLPANTVTTNIHIDYHDNINDYEEEVPTNFNYTSWHTYAVEWSPSKIIWYIDGIPSRLIPNHGIVDPVRIILNLAILRDHLPPTSPSFTDYMYVDFVKVYKLNCDDSNTNLTISNSTQLNNYNNSVKKNITIENASSTIKVQGESSTLRATDGIIINGDFEVPVGKEFYIDVNPCN